MMATVPVACCCHRVVCGHVFLQIGICLGGAPDVSPRSTGRALCRRAPASDTSVQRVADVGLSLLVVSVGHLDLNEPVSLVEPTRTGVGLKVRGACTLSATAA